MKLLRIPKFPKFKLLRPRKQPPQKLQARTRTADPSMADGYEEDEPQTKLTSAFIVVLVLHVVAVGGIYAFNQIKTSRRSSEVASVPIVPAVAKATPQKPPAPSVELEHAAQTAPAISHAAAPLAPVAPISKQRVYNVKPGDTLHSIAKAFSISVVDLKGVNSLSGDVIRPGQVLNLPSAKTPAEAPATPAKPVEASESKPVSKTYTVKSGDRLIFIAKKFSVSPEDLIAFNKIKDPAKLQIGQTLKIPGKKIN
jgi:LysM repeat protein